MLGINPDTARGPVPELLFATFQLGFAIVTAALVSGAIADRARFAAWMVFVPLWTVAVYAVVAHWVWAPGGWLFNLGALDYAGGLVVEIVSGMSALALALVLGPRIGFKKDAMRPHNLPFVLLGCGLLWFGWFGFNAGSALAANGMASAVFLNTLVAGCLGMLGWISVERIRDGRPTTFGAASGVIAGLVAITPSCGTVNTLGATVVGLAAGIVCSFAVGAKFKFGYDDSLDVVGVHFVGGVVGVILIGFLATEVMTGGAQGLFYGGGFTQLGKQALGAVVVGAYAFVMSYVLAKVIDRIMGFRISAEDETTGVDFTQHAETAYAEAVHGHQPSRRPTSFGQLGDLHAPGPRPEKAEEG
jgi:Amt family ammonium transporter